MVVFSVSGITAYRARLFLKPAWMCIFIVIALLFNPLSEIHLTKKTWTPINLVVAALITISLFSVKDPSAKKGAEQDRK